MNKIINKKTQLGISLIELLIAMTIGVFLLTGIASSYISSKKTSIERDQMSLLEDNGRIALETLTKVIQHTGYSSGDKSLLPFITQTADVASVACTDGSQSVVNTGIFTADRIVKDGAASDSDSIGVIFYGDNNLFRDCVGGELPAACRANPSKVYNSFYVSNGNLECVGSRVNKAHVVAEGVENIQFLYGVDTTADNLVDRYMTATDLALAAAGNATIWKSIISVQIAILVRSSKPVKLSAESRSYTLLDQLVTSANDKFKREVFTTTIRLRNTL